MIRCPWAGNDPLYIKYHDEEWGVPLFDDQLLFEFLTLETMQAGLSWITILRKRENFRAAFDDFDVKKVSSFSLKKINKLMENAGIIRNRRKLDAAVNNAKQFLKVQGEWGSFSDYIWHFVDQKPIKNKWKTMKAVPAKTPLSDEITKDLKKKGFKFVGSTTVYSHMQATGMVNDHITTCFRYHEVS